jgi:hypothetical protein
MRSPVTTFSSLTALSSVAGVDSSILPYSLPKPAHPSNHCLSSATATIQRKIESSTT